MTIVLLSVLAASVVSLLRAIRVGDRLQEIISKNAASLTFVVLGVLRWSRGDAVGAWILAGLVFCAFGDALLLGKKTFDTGLAAFLIGHILYVAGFCAALPIENWSRPALIPLLLAGAMAIRWLWPHLGRKRLPVGAYVVAITIMVWGGFSVATAGVLPWRAAIGAGLFYLSDLAVARHRFVQESFVNRALGLPLYYTGQALLALLISA